MRKLDAGQGNGRAPERLEASHGGASAFDRSMILLNEMAFESGTASLPAHPKKHACASSDTSDANSSTDFTSGLGS
jgi:hypothetical protein